ncbi:C11orf53 isoform 3 [Pan troglodytes]|uniref:POU class 2 homeobox associating factor 2 n=2 Tax=Homininae TaxID=207598 RepID=A0A1B0GU63_HUMAN|nr:hypothetical protein KI723_111696 [Homo sapiens]KAI4074033.1 hypothetical protein G5576_006524 [Homo sapiens]PNI40783.1 C11orf53 isoform 3 [Pan troglodytes]
MESVPGDYSKRVYQGVRVKHTVKDLLAEKRSGQTSNSRLNVRRSRQVTTVSEDLSYLTQTSTTVNSFQMTSTPPAWGSRFPVSPPQGRAMRLSWSPTSPRSPTETTGLRR